MEKRTFFGFSTGQPTTNLVSALQMRASACWLLESKDARDKDWASGAEAVLKTKGLRVERPPISDSVDIGDLTRQILAAVEGSGAATPVFGLGGGQKPHAIAIWDAFRAIPGSNAVYPDPTTKKLTIYSHGDSDSVIAKTVEMESQLSVDDLVATFRLRVVQGKARWTGPEETVESFGVDSRVRQEWLTKGGYEATREELSLGDRVRQLRDDPTQMAGFLREAEGALRHATDRGMSSGQITNCAGQLKNSAIRAIAGPGPTERALDLMSGLLEAVLARKVQRHVSSTRGVSLRTNIEIWDDTRRLQEHDVALVSRSTALVSLDAKTGRVDNKDVDARLQNLGRTSGAYAPYYTVLPCYERDLPEPWMQTWLGRALEHHRLGIPFCVLSDQPRGYWIKRVGESGTIQRCRENDGGILCSTVEEVLDKVL